MSTPPQVRVGIALFILHHCLPSNPIFLLGRRKGSHGAGTYALPGGHLEFSEDPATCAAREALEETGLEVVDIEFFTATNDYMPDEGKHYVTLWMVGRRKDEDREAEVLEKDKCEGWEWCAWEKFAEEAGEEGEVEGRRYFLPMRNLLRQRAGMVPVLR
ncbi:nudix domain protein [Zymoseptoria brevis]|uniref:Nudix domain protein n=1 Tax=Zymoseptoria brevis TaxID=1047168 RepID=A0A0F4GA96_9PEZI|nr:nudix domain protein [Zymoseptoria brevis]